MKYDWQLYALNTFSKFGLIASLVIYAIVVDRNNFSLGFYHFISLYGVICFSIALYFEYNRHNLILSFISILGLIAYQPLFSVLKSDVYDGSVSPNDIVLQITLLAILAWIIFDVIRWVRDFKNFIKNKLQIEDTNPATNLNIEILDLTDNQYSTMKLMYGNEITKEEALKKVNSIRAFKSVK